MTARARQRCNGRMIDHSARKRRGDGVAGIAARIVRWDVASRWFRYDVGELPLVTGRAIQRLNHRVVDLRARERCRNRMAGGALGASSWNMPRRRHALHTQQLSGMAGCAFAGRINCMCELCASKRRGALVAGVARLVGCDRNVIGRFWRDNAEKILGMTGRACTCDVSSVRELSPRERRRSRVAGIARLIGDERWNMIGGLTPSRNAMTACAFTRDILGMHERRTRKTRGALVARLARCGCCDMLGAFARRCGAVVARRAISRYAGVIEPRAFKADSIFVTGFARRCRCNVSRRFALGV